MYVQNLREGMMYLGSGAPSLTENNRRMTVHRKQAHHVDCSPAPSPFGEDAMPCHAMGYHPFRAI